jgi:Uma2 family endonuclease
MKQLKAKRRYTVEEYLRKERRALERHTYVDGWVTRMPSESISHGRITVNLVCIVGTQLKSTLWSVFCKKMRIRCGDPNSSQKGVMFCYPDLLVVDEEPICADHHQDIILNTAAVVETLSPKTEAFDRGEKFSRLSEHNSSLNDYILVSQDKPQIEHYTRRSEGGWTYQRYNGLDAVVSIPSIGCELKLVDVYARVKFEVE